MAHYKIARCLHNERGVFCVCFFFCIFRRVIGIVYSCRMFWLKKPKDSCFLQICGECCWCCWVIERILL